jgi:predicted amidohydrolase
MMRVAAIQLNSTEDKARNLAAAVNLVTAAAAAGAELLVLPEMFNVLGDADVLRAGAEPLDGPSIDWARAAARRHGVWLVAGSITERGPDPARHFNTSCLIDREGDVRAVYRKIHLFDVEVPGAVYRESGHMLAGRDVVVADAACVSVGLAICYDLRFPELFRTLTVRGARMVALPSAFTERTGRDHWETLVRARAIENQVFMVAADQVGGVGRLRWFGRSMIVDPWGVVLAQAPDRETYIVADLDFAAQDQVRAQLPCWRHRRPDVYGGPPG